MTYEEEVKARVRAFWEEKGKNVEYGYNPDGSIAWIRYPDVGDAWQQDKFIIEETKKFMQEHNKRMKDLS